MPISPALALVALFVGPIFMIVAAYMGSQTVALLVGAASASAVVFGAILSTIELRSAHKDAHADESNTARNLADLNAMQLASSARWNATAYGWGALSLMGTYYLAPLEWYHAYQYAAVMAVFAGIALWMVQQFMSDFRPWLRGLAGLLSAAQIVLAFGGIGYLVVTGKLGAAERADWMANIVFFAGAWMIAAISLLALPSVFHKPAE